MFFPINKFTFITLFKNVSCFVVLLKSLQNLDSLHCLWNKKNLDLARKVLKTGKAMVVGILNMIGKCQCDQESNVSWHEALIYVKI